MKPAGKSFEEYKEEAEAKQLVELNEAKLNVVASILSKENILKRRIKAAQLCIEGLSTFGQRAAQVGDIHELDKVTSDIHDELRGMDKMVMSLYCEDLFSEPAIESGSC